MRSPRSKPINVTFLAETPRFFRKLAGRSARGVVQDGNSPGLTTFIKSAYLPLACQIVLIASSISGSWLSGSIAFSSETFATLGLIPGIYTWSWGSGENADSMTLIIPEPSAGLLSLLGLGLLMKRRR